MLAGESHMDPLGEPPAATVLEVLDETRPGAFDFRAGGSYQQRGFTTFGMFENHRPAARYRMLKRLAGTAGDQQ